MAIKKKILITFVSLIAITSIGSYLLARNRKTQESPQVPAVEGLAVQNEITPTPSLALEPSPTPTPTPSPTPNPLSTSTPEPTATSTPSNKEYVHGFGEMSIDGYSVKLEMDIPVDGGKVTGTLAGSCTGTLEGSFAANTSSVLGTFKGVCQQFTAAGMFEGEIDLTEKVGHGTYEGKVFIFSRSGDWDLVIE